ncbi:MAG: hypothetical protein QOF16_1064, partial [Actinomycetota bacterium]|nr:hypothetical protein [Actinomycetota bacterium]
MVSAQPVIGNVQTFLPQGGMSFKWFFSPAWMIAFPLIGAVVLLFFGK